MESDAASPGTAVTISLSGCKKANRMPELALDKADLGAKCTGVSVGEHNWIFHLEGMTVWPRSQFKVQIRSGCLSVSSQNAIRTGWLYNINHSQQFSGPETTNKPRGAKKWFAEEFKAEGFRLRNLAHMIRQRCVLLFLYVLKGNCYQILCYFLFTWPY